jgi:predicted ATP-grasp superfamily ATP-dependent carboligase
VDRDALARAARRRQAADALALERDREKMLVEQLEELVAETDARTVDDAVFAAMAADEVELVRAALRTSLDDVESEFETFTFEEEEDAAGLQRAELTRLSEVLDECRRTQRALESYLQALDGAP